VSVDDWMLALHVLSAFSWVAGVVVFWVLITAVRKTETAEGTLRLVPAVRVGNAAVGVGMAGTIVFGLWLAFSVGGYGLSDGWIIAALVLWVISAALGQRTGAAYMQGTNKARELREAGQGGPDGELLALNRTPTGLVFQALWSVVTLLLLIDMIWKPGA
jgi:uncharacterized membrane protein